MTLLAGSIAPNPSVRLASAVSREAQTVWNVRRAALEAQERSETLFGAKARSISRIAELVAECQGPGWDGEQAAPLSAIAATSAERFVRALPSDVPLPEFAPEPDGSISLDWIESRHRLFTLSIGANDRLAYAWIDGSDRGYAVARFDGFTVPHRILEGIRSVVQHGDTVIGAA